jgi:UDP-glucose 4,6-dehydratase
LTPPPPPSPPPSCDKKLLELGWQERTPWEEGLRKTIDWYLTHANRDYWMHGDMELALDAHPTLQLPSFGSTTLPALD